MQFFVNGSPVCGDTVPLGVQGENLATQITADVSGWLDQWPDGQVIVRLIDANRQSHLADTVVNDGTLVWIVTAADTAQGGYGVGVIELVQGDVVKKSEPFATRVITDPQASGQAPEPVPGWVEETIARMEELEAGAAQSADAAQTSAGSAQTGAQSAQAAAAQAAQSAEDAAAVLSQVEAAGADQRAAIQAAGQQQTQAVTAAGAQQVSAVQTEGADQRAAIETAGAAQVNAIQAEGQTQQTAIQQKGAETLASIPADYTELSGDVADLKSEISEAPSIVTPEESAADLYLCDPQGNVVAKFQDGHIVTKHFDSGAIQLDLIMEADSDAADLYIADSFGNVVAEFKDGEIITKNFNSSDYAGVLHDIATLQNDVSALQSATSGIMYRMQPYIDGVYAACKYKTASNHQFCILAAGDCHSNSAGPANMIEVLNNVDAVDCAVMLGDIVSTVFADGIDHYAQALPAAQKPVLTVLGNHDVRGAASDAELWAKYGALYEYADLASGEAVDGKCYYYKDFALQKMRVIVLMQYDYIYTGELCFGQAQINWLISTLEATPSDYAVIICEHTNPSRYMTYNMDAAYTANTWRRSNYAPTAMDGDPVPDIIDAWIKGASLAKTYDYTYDSPPSPLSVNADFSSRGAGEFVTYLGGHWHQNVLGNVTDHTGQMDFHVQANSYSYSTWSGDIPRKIGTVSEDSFCAIAVDRDAKTVKVFQVGAHYTCAAYDRQYFQYTYGGEG